MRGEISNDETGKQKSQDKGTGKVSQNGKKEKKGAQDTQSHCLYVQPDDDTDPAWNHHAYVETVQRDAEYGQDKTRSGCI